jgi:hypothetical protein
MPEYRARVTIPGLPLTADDQHDALMDALVRDAGELGPVMTWTDDQSATIVILATDAPDEATAAGELLAAVIDSLRSAGLEHLYPTAVELEAVDDREPAAA